MKNPKISNQLLGRLNKVHRILWLAFAFGLPLGVGILLMGSIVPGFFDTNVGNQESPRVSALAEMVMALACMALAMNCLLEGFVFVRGFAKTVRFGISGVLIYTLVAMILTSGAIMLGVFAVRNWLRS
jgi:hypothetical protein